MTSVVVVGQFSIRPSDVNRIRRAAPDIEAIDVVDSIALLRQRLAQPSPCVGIIHGDLATMDVAGIAKELANGGPPAAFIVAANAGRGTEIGRALRDGARGFVLIDSPVEELVTAVRAVVGGHLYIPSAYVHELGETLLMLACRQNIAQRGNILTQRECDVLGLVACGYPNSEIAASLFISEATVRSHVLSILRKLNVRNRTEAVVQAYQTGLLEMRTSDGAPMAVSLGGVP